jgi:hypothetical protein
VDGPLPLPAGRRPTGRIEAASRRTRMPLVCEMSTLDSWRPIGAPYAEQESTGKALRVVRRGRSMAALMIWERINCVANSQKVLCFPSEIVNFLKAGRRCYLRNLGELKFHGKMIQKWNEILF